MKKNNLFERLEALAKNLWWTWKPDAQQLFAAMDPPLWEATKHNPIRTMRLLSAERRNALADDEGFERHLARVEKNLAKYLSQGKRNLRPRNMLIAYFCAEFAIHESLPQYSGGLGVLAGDHVKSASDLGLPFVGIGLLYRCGYYTQELRSDGSTRVIYPLLDFSECPITDTRKFIDVPMAKRKVRAKIWRQGVGRVSLYLLDTDVPQNSKSDRELTRHLYGGEREYRIQQEILLGIGGVMALEKLGLKPTVYHLNEGHAAFCALEHVRRLHKSGKTIPQATGIVRKSTVFTTHTPVPAGNDRFAPALTMKYLGAIGSELGVKREQLLALGREDPADKSEEFCMTVLALRLAAHCNGVAKLHGETSRAMWTRVFGTSDPNKVPIGHVTNGVHAATWTAPEMQALGARFKSRIPDDELWKVRNLLRRRMIHFIRQRLVDQVARHNGSADDLIAAQSVLDEDALTIGFARRFATYKRAPLVFREANRLAKILRKSGCPVQLIFAGKAHPKDIDGQKFAQEIYRHAKSEKFRGRVVLLEDYDMQMGRMLTSGCDVWLNNPLRPQEASGTSGMKPPLHGGINCSILDGWWPEAFNGKNGWAIGDGRQFDNRAQQDRYDADAIYKLLEREIVPEFYSCDRKGIPTKWVKRMRESMRTVNSQFNTHRMVNEYLQKFYLPASA